MSKINICGLAIAQQVVSSEEATQVIGGGWGSALRDGLIYDLVKGGITFGLEAYDNFAEQQNQEKATEIVVDHTGHSPDTSEGFAYFMIDALYGF